MKKMITTIFISLFPVLVWADSFLGVAFENTSEFYLEKNGAKIGFYDGAVLDDLTGDFSFENNTGWVKINNPADGEYLFKIKSTVENEKILIHFQNENGIFSEHLNYLFLPNSENNIYLQIENGELQAAGLLIFPKNLKLQDQKLTWDKNSLAKSYNIYKRSNDNFVFLENTSDNFFDLNNASGDFFVTLVLNKNNYVNTPIFPNILGGFVSSADSDHDGITDEWEDILGTDKNSADSDHDGISDKDELLETNTDPTVENSSPAHGRSGKKRKKKVVVVPEEEPVATVEVFQSPAKENINLEKIIPIIELIRKTTNPVVKKILILALIQILQNMGF